MTACLPSIRNVLTPLAKSVLMSWGLTAAVLVTDSTIQKKSFGSGMTVFIISNKEMYDVMKIIKTLKESGLLVNFKKVDFSLCY